MRERSPWRGAFPQRNSFLIPETLPPCFSATTYEMQPRNGIIPRQRHQSCTRSARRLNRNDTTRSTSRFGSSSRNCTRRLYSMKRNLFNRYDVSGGRRIRGRPEPGYRRRQTFSAPTLTTAAAARPVTHRTAAPTATATPRPPIRPPATSLSGARMSAACTARPSPRADRARLR